jgi:hypothetical protein
MAIFIEYNLINQYDNNNKKYEYADPDKLYKIFCNFSNIWKKIKIKESNEVFHYMKIPWEYDNSLYFYVLTDNILLFESIPINFKEWLNIYKNESFLISCSIFDKNDLSENEELQTLINNNKYTICNGLILLLAYHRLHIIKKKYLYGVLKDWYIDYKKNNHYYIINDKWSELYYKNISIEIADYPYYYLCFGPKFGSNEIRKLFYNCNDESLVQLIKGHTAIVTSSLSVMYPYFNKDIFNSYKLIINPYTRSYYLNIDGYIKSILSTHKSWLFWKKNKYNNINNLFNYNIKNIFNLFIPLIINIYIYDICCKKRARELWNICISYINIQELLPYISIRDIPINVGIVLLKDLLRKYNINMYNHNKDIYYYILLANNNKEIKSYFKSLNKRTLKILCILSKLDNGIYGSMINYLKLNKHILEYY